MSAIRTLRRWFIYDDIRPYFNTHSHNHTPFSQVISSGEYFCAFAGIDENIKGKVTKNPPRVQIQLKIKKKNLSKNPSKNPKYLTNCRTLQPVLKEVKYNHLPTSYPKFKLTLIIILIGTFSGKKLIREHKSVIQLKNNNKNYARIRSEFLWLSSI